jgi:hypothetical protein
LLKAAKGVENPSKASSVGVKLCRLLCNLEESLNGRFGVGTCPCSGDQLHPRNRGFFNPAAPF